MDYRTEYDRTNYSEELITKAKLESIELIKTILTNEQDGSISYDDMNYIRMLVKKVMKTETETIPKPRAKAKVKQHKDMIETYGSN